MYNKRHTLFFHLSYESGAAGIKVEISKRSSGSRYETAAYMGISMLVMKKEDVAANKLVALTERRGTANRDLYDIWYFLKNNWDYNDEIIETRTGMKTVEYFKKCAAFVEKISERHIMAGMGELLDAKTKGWVKANLKKELIFLLKLHAGGGR